MKALKVSSSVRELIEADLKKNPNNQYVIARRYGVTKGVVQAILRDMENPNARSIAQPVTVNVTPDEIPERLREFLIEVKPVCAEWSMSDALKKARQEYDDGLVELCVGRIRRAHGDVLVLYRIPRVRPTQRRPYFSSIYEG